MWGFPLPLPNPINWLNISLLTAWLRNLVHCHDTSSFLTQCQGHHSPGHLRKPCLLLVFSVLLPYPVHFLHPTEGSFNLFLVILYDLSSPQPESLTGLSRRLIPHAFLTKTQSLLARSQPFPPFSQMFPPPNQGHVALAVPRAAPEASLATAVTTTLPTHHRPTIGAFKPDVDDDPTPSVNAIIVTMSIPVVGSPTSTPDPEIEKGECSLLGPFALLVQLALGALALLSLVYKRWRERPQRPVKIWFFDASKQVFGSVLVHMANVFMSLLTSGRFDIKTDPIAVGHVARRAVMMLVRRGDEYTPNPCSFYLLNLGIDVRGPLSQPLFANHLFRQPGD